MGQSRLPRQAQRRYRETFYPCNLYRPLLLRLHSKRRVAPVLETIQCKSSMSEASRTYDLPTLEVEAWVDAGMKGMKNVPTAKPETPGRS